MDYLIFLQSTIYEAVNNCYNILINNQNTKTTNLITWEKCLEKISFKDPDNDKIYHFVADILQVN